jgi:hypothetical protein
MSSSFKCTSVSGPNTAPEHIKGMKAYAILPAAPVMVHVISGMTPRDLSDSHGLELKMKNRKSVRKIGPNVSCFRGWVTWSWARLTKDR